MIRMVCFSMQAMRCRVITCLIVGCFGAVMSNIMYLLDRIGLLEWFL
jgi:hypothetical protein